jgi:hypothetical protein
VLELLNHYAVFVTRGFADRFVVVRITLLSERFYFLYPEFTEGLLELQMKLPRPFLSRKALAIILFVGSKKAWANMRIRIS